MEALKHKKVTLPVPGTDSSAVVTVISALKSPYGMIQDYISDHIIETSTFFEAGEVERIVKELKPGDLFVDVGANLGTFTAAARAVGAETISIEPQPILQTALKANAGKGKVHAVAVGTSKEELEIHEAFMRHPRRGTIMANLGGNDLIGEGGRRKSGEKVKVATLDSLLKDKNPTLIKIDVEGMEADVLRSGLETITRAKPILYLEQNHMEQMSECFHVLEPLGYRISDVIGGLGSSVVVRYAAS